MTYGKIPDAEAIVVNILNASSVLQDIAGENPASTELEPGATLPKIRVTLSGGSPVVRGWLHSFRFNIEAWATSKEEAFELLIEAGSVLENGLDGAQVSEGVVTSFTQETGLTWSPDPSTNTARYLVGFVGHIHPNI